MTGSEFSAEGVTLALTHDEALVLFEWLHTSAGKHAFSDQAEQRVLRELEASLERQLTALLSPNYARLLDEARSRLRDCLDWRDRRPLMPRAAATVARFCPTWRVRPAWLVAEFD